MSATHEHITAQARVNASLSLQDRTENFQPEIRSTLIHLSSSSHVLRDKSLINFSALCLLSLDGGATNTILGTFTFSSLTTSPPANFIPNKYHPRRAVHIITSVFVLGSIFWRNARLTSYLFVCLFVHSFASFPLLSIIAQQAAALWLNHHVSASYWLHQYHFRLYYFVRGTVGALSVYFLFWKLCVRVVQYFLEEGNSWRDLQRVGRFSICVESSDTML